MEKNIIPKQKTGTRTGATSSYVTDTRHLAVTAFEQCKKLLLNVNKWKAMCGDKGADFQLTDDMGQEIQTKPIIGNLIRIKIPAPENTLGDGFDWVEIEAFLQSKDLIKDEESFGFRVRPIQNPLSPGGSPAHFFSRDTTSTFLVTRCSATITVMERGRNEVVNKQGSFLQRFRNLVVAVPAMLGFSTPQWKLLTSGILNTALSKKQDR